LKIPRYNVDMCIPRFSVHAPILCQGSTPSLVFVALLYNLHIIYNPPLKFCHSRISDPPQAEIESSLPPHLGTCLLLVMCIPRLAQIHIARHYFYNSGHSPSHWPSVALLTGRRIPMAKSIVKRVNKGMFIWIIRTIFRSTSVFSSSNTSRYHSSRRTIPSENRQGIDAFK
jgi:hypothetical protein